MSLALVIVMLFYIVLLYVLGMLGCECMYGQLLVLVLQPCCSCSLSCAHVIGWNCILMSEINNNNNNNNNESVTDVDVTIDVNMSIRTPL